MLTIRNQQVEAFSDALYRDFEGRAIQHLRKFFPEQTGDLSDRDMKDYVGNCVKRAAGYGLESEQAVMCFAHQPLLLGTDFETNPRWGLIPSVLSDERYSDTDRAKIAMMLAYAFKARGL